LDWYKAEHPTTIKQATSEVKLFRKRFGHRPTDSIRPIEVEQYKKDRLDGSLVSTPPPPKNGKSTKKPGPAAQETVGKEIRRLSAAFKRGVEWGELSSNPMSATKAPRGVRDVAVRFYDRRAMRRLYRANRGRAFLWMFMANTGLRRGEVVGLRKLAIVGGRLRIESDPDGTGKGRTKSGRWREVPLNRKAAFALAKLPDPLTNVHKDTISDWFAADARLAGVGGTLHRLRHTFCAHMAIKGVPLRRIQLLAGHADYATTEKYYAHLTPEGDNGAVRRLGI